MKNILTKVNCILERKMKKELVGVFLLTLAGAMLELVGVSIILPLINLALDPGGIENNKECRLIMQIFGIKEPEYALAVLILMIILLYIIKNIYLSIMNSTIYQYSMKVRRKLCAKLMENYIRRPYYFFLERNSAELIRSVNMDVQGFYEVLYNFLLLVSNMLMVSAIVIFLAYTNIVMTLVIAALIGLTALTLFRFLQKKARALGVINQRTQAEVIKSLQQSFSGIKEIKILGCEEQFIADYDRKNYRGVNTQRKAQLISVLPKYLIETLAVGGILIVLLVSILLGGNYNALIGQLGAFAVAAFKLLPSVNSSYTYMNTIMYNKAAIDVLHKELSVNEAENCDKEEITFKENITLENVWFQYRGMKDYVLEQVNICICKGDSVAFIGESGGGKTTLADIVLGLLAPNQGKVLIDSQDVSVNLKGWRSKIGYIPQTIYLTDDTIRKNIAFGIAEEEIDEERVWKALEEAQLLEYVQKLPQQLSTMVGERGVCLSGGQRQRVGIARALYRDTEVLVFDEATSALDTETEKEVMQAIDNLHGTKTIIMIAHRLSTIEKCDRIFKIQNKTVVEIKKQDVQHE